MSRKSPFLFAVIFASLLTLFFWGCGPKAPQLILDAEDQYTVAMREYEKERWSEAVIELQKLIFNYPGVAFIDSAQYLLGMAYFNQKEYPSAIQEFNKILYSYPTSPFSDDAAFMITNCDFKMSPKAELDPMHTQKALDGIERFLEDYPQSERRQEAEELLVSCKAKLAKKAYQAGELYFKRGQYSASLIYLGHILNDYHDTKWVKKALFLQAEVFFKQGEYDKAKEGYKNFLLNYPDDKLTKKAEKRLKKIEEKGDKE